MPDSSNSPTRSDFDAQMQDLADEVEKRANTKKPGTGSDTNPGSQSGLESRIGDLKALLVENETAVSSQSSSLDQMVATLEGMAEQVRNRNSRESANQELFDALHGELKSYKDNFLLDALQKPIIRDLLVHYDDTVRLAVQARGVVEAAEGGAGVSGEMQDLAANLENNVHSLLELFQRLDVVMIEDAAVEFDKSIHRAVQIEPAPTPEENGMIISQVRDGFRWRNAVLRPVDVVIKKSEKR